MGTTGSRHDPFMAFRFEIRLTGLPVSGFGECSGLQLETELQTYNEGGNNSFVRHFPTRTKQSNITLKRGIVDREIWTWYFDVIQGLIHFRDASIIVYDAAGVRPAAQWDIRRALPIKWIGPQLNATQNQVAVETLELAHHGLTLVQLPPQ